MSSHRLQALCGLGEGEVAVCCLNIGTVAQRKARARIRPLPAVFATELSERAALGVAQ